MSMFPYIFGFYSFKGGVGRTMAVANVAYVLASRGRNVLVLDLDLEAPGLGIFLRDIGELGDPAPADVIDLLAWANTAVAEVKSPVEGAPLLRESFPPVEDYATPVRQERIESAELRPQFGSSGRIDVIPVDRDRAYHERLKGLGLSSLTRDHLIRLGTILRAFLKSCRVRRAVPDYYGLNGTEELPYDYVLIDSRTGNTEIGGLCLGPLTDRVVVLTGLNHQNIENTARFLRDVGIDAARSETSKPWDEADVPPPHGAGGRLAPKPTLVVASPVPSGETELKRDRLAALGKALGGSIACQLSYHPRVALEEAIFVRKYGEELLAAQYAVLCDQLQYAVADHPFQLAERSQLAFEGGMRKEVPDGDVSDSRHRLPLYAELGTRKEVLDAILRLTPQVPQVGLPLLQHVASNFIPYSDEDYLTTDRMFRILTQPEAPRREVGYRLWGIRLGNWAKRDAPVEIKEARYQESLNAFTAGLSLAGLAPIERSSLFFNRGAAKEQHEDYQGAVEDYTHVLDSGDAPQETRLKAMLGRGLCLGKAGNYAPALNELTAVAEAATSNPELRARAILNRAIVHQKAGEINAALADYSDVITMANVPVSLRGRGRVNRGLLLARQGDGQGAIREFNAVIADANIELELRCRALHFRGEAREKEGASRDGAVDKRAAQILAEDPNTIKNTAATILYELHGMPEQPSDEINRAAQDLLLSLPGLPSLFQALLHYNRGYDRLQERQLAEAQAEFTTVIQLGDQASIFRTLALQNRGAARDMHGDTVGAREDFETVLATPNVPSEHRARALVGRGYLKLNSGDAEGAASDLDQALATKGATTSVLAAAFSGRGWCAYLQGDYHECVRLTRMSLSLEPRQTLPRGNLALALLRLGEEQAAQREYSQALLAVTSTDQLDALAKDLRDVLPSLSNRDPGERVLAQIEERLQELEKQAECAG